MPVAKEVDIFYLGGGLRCAVYTAMTQYPVTAYLGVAVDDEDVVFPGMYVYFLEVKDAVVDTKVVRRDAYPDIVEFIPDAILDYLEGRPWDAEEVQHYLRRSSVEIP